MRSREARRRSRRGRSQGQAYKCSFWCLLLLHNSTFWSTLLHARERRVTQKLKTDGASRSLLRQVSFHGSLRPCQNGFQDGCQNGTQNGTQMGPKLVPKMISKMGSKMGPKTGTKIGQNIRKIYVFL